LKFETEEVTGKEEEEFTATSFAEATEGQEGAKVAKGRGGRRVRGYELWVIGEEGEEHRTLNIQH
jgi:hypothetical protein